MASPIGGQGPILPFVFDDAGEIQLVTDHDLIVGALSMIFDTSPGQMPMDKDFGHTLVQILFLNWNQTTKTIAERLVGSVLQAFEDRIEVIDIDAQRSDKVDEIKCRVTYRLRSDGTTGSTSVSVGV